MRTCLSGLIETWGIDPESRATGLQGVRPKNQKRWARKTLESYPSEALRRGIGGSVRVRVIVGTDGKPKSCLSLQGFSAEILQRAACDAMMKYSRFEPALDKDGEPMVSYFLTSITYSPN
jgi:TonB family protein